MPNYILVHGSAHGSWCWQRITPLLQQQGHTVTPVDLPGNGHDDTPLAQVTLDTYAQHLCRILDAHDNPSILVGHSLGGLSISRAAELRPHKIAVLVYLTALLLEANDTFVPTQSANPDQVRQALETRPGWNIADDLTYVTYKPELAPHRFYNDCSPADTAWAQSMLVPQPVGPLISPLTITNANYGRVPRIYIECAQDNAVTPERAREMYTALPCAQIITMQTGHSPFLSAPNQLARHLNTLALYATPAAESRPL